MVWDFKWTTHIWVYHVGSFCQWCGPESAGRCTAAYCLRCNCACDWREPAGTSSPVAWSSVEVSCDLQNTYMTKWDILMASHTHTHVSIVCIVNHFILFSHSYFTGVQHKGSSWPRLRSNQSRVPLHPTSLQTGNRVLYFHTSLSSPHGNVNQC